MLETLASEPYEPTCAFYLLVGPRRHMPAGFRVVQHPRFGEHPVELSPSSCVSFQPAIEIRHARQEVALAAVARVVRKHKVIAEIARIAHPGNKVVDVPGTRDPPVALEAAPGLDLQQGAREPSERAAVCAKEKLRDVTSLTD